ncbi:hypothetical protein [Pontibacter beigongshangensis]|uniref:hypothetical protein n=1 Tax=Pontibacter beigongshangensis TaxID=2574733 RepID=UPI00164F9069|nr:hypothetical protein [Pontibacter beigongshangensis]
MTDKAKGRKLFFIAVLFLVLLNFPVISVFNTGGVVAGVSVLYAYMMLAWLACIVCVGLVVERQGEKEKSTKE